MRIKFKFVLFGFMSLCTWASAQTLPQDASVRKGTLANGMTYYIRHNHQTPNVAEFYIAQNVGSILEEPRQRGLAHFLEHMAFNGTQNFPGAEKKGLRDWCEKVGIKFGANLNAYTSIDETVYNISSAPVDKAGVTDTCLLILHDWSHYLLLTDQEIDKERGVITEEWRTRRSKKAMQRMWENAMPVVYKGSKYEDCMPIGSMDIVKNFPYKDLRDYYNKWYRPDLQAIIVVGDINVDTIEQKIKRMFDTIPVPKNPAERIYYPVPDNKEMIVYTEQDKEQPIPIFTLYMKREATARNQKNTLEYFRDDYISSIVRRAMTDRLLKIAKQEKPPFLSATMRDGSFFLSNTKDAVSISVSCINDSIASGIKAGVIEIERLRQHGISEGEMKRAKAELLKWAEKLYAERDTRRNGYYVNECVRNFTECEPILSEEETLRLIKQMNEQVTLADVNKYVSETVRDSNEVATLFGPDKEKIKNFPTSEEIRQIVQMVQHQTISANVEDIIPDRLMKKLPKAGKIKQEKNVSNGYREFVLSNGMRVYAKSTDIEADNIKMKLFSLGGRSIYGDDDMPSLKYLSTVIASGGLADMSEDVLGKVLAGKNVKVVPYVGDETEGMTGHCSVSDLESMLQLTYLYFTQPHRDDEMFNGMMAKQRSFLANRDANPNVTLGDSVNAIVYGNHPRVQPVKVETIDKVSYDRILTIYKERFADASDFDVILTGKIDFDKLRPLICRYLASLPAKGKKEKVIDRGVDIRRVNETHEFKRNMATPSAITKIFITTDMPYNAVNDLKFDVLCQLMRMVYTEKVREEQGGTYGVSVSGELSREPRAEAVMSISFSTDPEQYAKLIPIIYQQLDSMALNGPKPTELEKVKEYEKKTYGQLVVNNDYWEYIKYNELRNFIDFDKDYLKLVESLTVEDIKQTAKQLLAPNNKIQVTMLPE